MVTQNTDETAAACQKSGREKWQYVRTCANERENASVQRLSCRDVRELLAERDDLLAALEELCADKYLADPINADRMKNARAAIAKAKGVKLASLHTTI